MHMSKMWSVLCTVLVLVGVLYNHSTLFCIGIGGWTGLAVIYLVVEACMGVDAWFAAKFLCRSVEKAGLEFPEVSVPVPKFWPTFVKNLESVRRTGKTPRSVEFRVHDQVAEFVRGSWGRSIPSQLVK